MELIGWWNRSVGGSAWGIDRLVESLCVEIELISLEVETIDRWNQLVGGINRLCGGYSKVSFNSLS